jgi:hypothetical protein
MKHECRNSRDKIVQNGNILCKERRNYNTEMMQVMPSPLADIIYIKYKVWDLLPNSKKTAYYNMQKSTADNHAFATLKLWWGS